MCYEVFSFKKKNLFIFDNQNQYWLKANWILFPNKILHKKFENVEKIELN